MVNMFDLQNKRKIFLFFLYILRLYILSTSCYTVLYSIKISKKPQIPIRKAHKNAKSEKI